MSGERLQNTDGINRLTPIEREIKDSYLSFLQTAELIQQKLGRSDYVPGFGSVVFRKYASRYALLFHRWISEHKEELPSVIPLQTGSSLFEREPVKQLPGVRTKGTRAEDIHIVFLTQRDYLLPRQQMLYTYTPTIEVGFRGIDNGVGFLTDNTHVTDPDSADFLGCETVIKTQPQNPFYDTKSIDYYGTSSVTKLGYHQYLAALEFLSGFCAGNPKLTEELESLKLDLKLFKRERDSTIEELTKEFAPLLEKCVASFTEALIQHPSLRSEIPTYLELGATDQSEACNETAAIYYPRQNRLVVARKKTKYSLWRREKTVYLDLKHAEEATDKIWLSRAPFFIIPKLLTYLPEDTYKIIRGA